MNNNKDDFLVSLKKVGKIDVPESLTYHSALEAVAKELCTYDREVACVMVIDKNNKPLHTSMIHQGTINESLFSCRDVLKPALVDKKAEKMVVLHNHPSGFSEPSVNDIEVTKRLRELSNLVGISLIDHFTVGRDGQLCSIYEKMGLPNQNIFSSSKDSRKSLNIVRTVLSPKYQENNENTNITNSGQAMYLFERLYSDTEKNSLAVVALNSKNYPVKIIGLTLEKLKKPIVMQELYKNIILSNAPKVLTGTNITHYTPEIEQSCNEILTSLHNFLEKSGINQLDDIFITPNEAISMADEQIDNVFELGLKNKVSEVSMNYSNEEFEKYKTIVEELIEKDYRNFFKAIVSIEKDINNSELLDKIYFEWMKSDDIELLDPQINELLPYKNVNLSTKI